MRNTLLLLTTLAVLVASVQAFAAGIPTITLKSTRTAALNDGRDYHEIIADIRDSTGGYIRDGLLVTFQTNAGQFTGNASVPTRLGQARVKLTSMQKGSATVTATVEGGGFQQIQVSFTDDKEETFQGNSYIDVQAAGSLLYSAGDKIIEAAGRVRKEGDLGLPGATLTYRNVEIFADSLQLDCAANVVRATGNVQVTRGGKKLKCVRLYLPLNGGDGYAIVEQDRKLAPVKLIGTDLRMEPAPTGIAPAFTTLKDLSEAPLIITARHIRLFPGDKLQFKKPHFYQEGQQIVSMPFYSLGLYSTQLFTDQFLSVGSQGLGLDMPLYYDLSPTSTGIFHVRHGEPSGRTMYATRPGWSLDMTHAYNSMGGDRRFTGEFGLTGISRSDWGFRWNHSQEINSLTRGSFFFDMPQHRALFASTNLSHELGPLHLGLNLSGNRSLSGFSTSGTAADAYLETVPKKVGNTGYRMALGATASMLNTQSQGYRSNLNTRGVQARFYSNPFRFDRATTLTNYMTVGSIWSNQGRSGGSFTSSLTANRILGPGANMQMTYDFTQTPVFLPEGGKHRLSANLLMSGGTKWNLMAFGSTILDGKNQSLVGDFNYAIAPRWRLSVAATLQQVSTATYRDFAFSLARSIGGRDIGITYSTFTHRVYFDLQASRF
jgi:hypothetical protein